MILYHLFILLPMCWLKSSLESKTRPNCFYGSLDCTLLFLKFKDRWETWSRWCEKHTSVACFVGSGLNNLFHCCAHWLISVKSLFSSVSESFLYMALAKRDVSSTNILHSEFTPSDRPFIFISINNGPKQILVKHQLNFVFHEDVCLFKTTNCFRYFQQIQQITIYAMYF